MAKVKLIGKHLKLIPSTQINITIIEEIIRIWSFCNNEQVKFSLKFMLAVRITTWTREHCGSGLFVNFNNDFPPNCHYLRVSARDQRR